MTSTKILTLESNASALSEHRMDVLLKAIQSNHPGYHGHVEARWIYFIQISTTESLGTTPTKPTLSKEESDLMIIQLLQAKFCSTFRFDPPLSFLVYPRLGTLSSWSSKATDIFHVCGLTNVLRVERGLLYRFTDGFTFQPESAFFLFDPMLETLFTKDTFVQDLSKLFDLGQPRPLITIPLTQYSDQDMTLLNQKLGLGLNSNELSYVSDFYKKELHRDPTDVELMMYAQVNSEHCRHKIFNATWEIDQIRKENTLFEMIKNTYNQSKAHILSAYSDNAAVLEGPMASRFFCDAYTKVYQFNQDNDEPIHMVIKVETHNHPTAVSPHPGASTGTGGEIRDEGSVGQGSQSKAGLAGFTVNHLRIPNHLQPWEESNSIHNPYGSSALDIMIQAPLGAASFGNEFGRPNLAGYFRTFSHFENKENHVTMNGCWGYTKPIMLAGGMGQIRPMHIHKKKLTPASKLIVLGGPCMLIGLGGGAASSVSGGTSSKQLDYASVQRANPEMQRRCQMVIDQCTALGVANPIVAIHDVGAGGLSNALPELVHDADLGAFIQLRQILCDDQSLSPMEIWCNESQERYVLGLPQEKIPLFQEICERERCPFAIVGEATLIPKLIVYDSFWQTNVVDVPMDFLFSRSPRMNRKDRTLPKLASPLCFDFSLPQLTLLKEAVNRVLQFPAVADKSFLIHIADRFVGGLTTRDQCVGKWQVPVSDVAVISTSFETWSGEAMALGERPPLSLLSPVSSVRMAVGEALLNILAANIESLSHVRLSANWMAAVSQEGQGSAIYEAVETLGQSLCPDLQIAIPVGKDSLSMQSNNVISPLSLNVTSYAVVKDTRFTFTPCLMRKNDSILVLVDLSHGETRLGGSVLAQVFNQIGDEPPNFEYPASMRALWKLLQSPFSRKHVLAYHDKSDGGLLVTIVEMCFAGRLGFQWDLPFSLDEVDTNNASTLGLLSYLFNEELGVVVQIAREHFLEFCDFATSYGLDKSTIHVLGSVDVSSYELTFNFKNQKNATFDLFEWRKLWSSTSSHIKELRDHPAASMSEFQTLSDRDDQGLFSSITFDFPLQDLSPFSRPKVAILRDQGVNSYMEMAYAFHAAGFTSVDLHMTDLLKGKFELNEFVGLAACGGFSYGDVLGAGRGWAMSILGNSKLKESFRRFFHQSNTFALGVCNGCQMFSYLKELFPDPSTAIDFPYFEKNKSEQFEARTVMVEIVDSKSIFFQSMSGTCLPIPVAHGEGFTKYTHPNALSNLKANKMTALRYIEKPNTPTETYPKNPNGSQEGWTGFTSSDGRITLLMPHPERATRWVGQSWIADEWRHDGFHSPWLKMFQSARRFIA